MRKPIQKNSFSILIIFIALCMIGASVIPKLRLQLYPSTTTQTISVSFSWSEAATSRILEQEVCTPLEGVLCTLNGLVSMNSTTNKGSGFISLEFRKGTNMQKTKHEISALIRQVYPKLPEGVGYPSVHLRSGERNTEAPILTYFFNGPFDLNQLYDYADNHIKNKFSHIKELDEVYVTGGVKSYYQLVYDENQLKSLGLSRNDIANSIRLFNDRSSLGLTFTDDDLDKQLFVQINYGELEKNFWDKIIVKNHQGHFIKLTDLCTIERKEEEPRSYDRINGLNTINLYFKPLKGVNHLVLARLIKERIAEISPQLPPKHSFQLAHDSTKDIKKDLNTIIIRTCFTVFILLLFVLVISLSFRYLLVILISLSCNILLSFSLYALLGIDIHLFSLAGITISLGLIIDNSIIMIDHIRYYRNKRVYLALLASTLTTIASLTIVLFLPDSIKVNLVDFSKIIMINLGVSLIIALWFIPSLLEKLPLKRIKGKLGNKRRRRVILISNGYEKFIRFFIRRKWALILIAILGFGIPTFKLPDKLEGEGKAKEFYNKTIGSRVYQNKIKPISDVVLGGALRLSPAFRQSYFSGYNQDDVRETKVHFSAMMDKGIPTKTMNEVFIGFENFLATFDGIKQFTTNISGQRGNIEITFTPENQYSYLPYVIQSKLTNKLIDLGGMGGNVSGVSKPYGQSIGVSESISYRISLFGFNFEELKRQCNILKDKLVHKRIRNMNIDLSTSGRYYYYDSGKDYEFIINADQYLINSYNKHIRQVSDYINRTSITSQSQANILQNNRYETVLIRSKQSLTNDKWTILNSPIIRSGGFPLAALGNIEKKDVSPAINKYNQMYKRTIGYTFVGTPKLGDRIKKRAVEAMRKELPLGYFIEEDDRYSYYRPQIVLESYHFIVIVVLCIFIISSILFESLRQPLAIISIIPLSYIGVFLTFHLADISFNKGGAASFVLITGLVVNSAIYIVNEYNNKKRILAEKGRSISTLKLYMKAFNSKIIPVFLTITSSILGLIPFMMLGKKDAFWYAFSGGSVGGLVFSLIVLIIYLPMFLVRKKDKVIIKNPLT